MIDAVGACPCVGRDRPVMPEFWARSTMDEIITEPGGREARSLPTVAAPVTRGAPRKVSVCAEVVPAVRAAVALLAVALTGCSTYRVEYRTRPSYVHDLAAGDLPSRVTLEDGTVLVFQTRDSYGLPERISRDDAKPFRPWEETEEGEIIVRALLPEHVLAVTLQCLHTERYDVLYNQVLASKTRDSYEARDDGRREFAEFFIRNRTELTATVNRLLVGVPRNDAVVENVPGGIIRVRLYSHIAEEYRFTMADMVSEQGGLKLLLIH